MFKDTILDIFKDCSFEDLTDTNFGELIFENLPFNFSYEYNYGASKLVILPDYEDRFVIKIPFLGYIDTDDEFYKFSGANWDSHRYWDYCFTELLMYHYAEKAGVERILAKPHLLGTVNGHPIYIQERAETYRAAKGEKIKRNSKQSISKTHTLCSKKNYKMFNLDWITDVYNYYGSKHFDKIMRYISSIGDLHDDNIGYIGSRPVIFDYSDFMT